MYHPVARKNGMNGGPGLEGRQARAGLLLLVALALGAYAYQCHLFSHYVNDDAYITFRYSRFLALGRGPYFNPGERVEGYTNPLLMIAMAPVIALGGPDAAPAVAKGIGVASGALALLAGFWLTRRLGGCASSPMPIPASTISWRSSSGASSGAGYG